MRMSDMSAQVKDMRSQMEENEQLSVLMAGLRGSNTNDDDWAGKDVVMQLISVSDADGEVSGSFLSSVQERPGVPQHPLGLCIRQSRSLGFLCDGGLALGKQRHRHTVVTCRLFN